LVELEVAFDRVRRVHALARFYNPDIQREPGEDEFAEAGRCPICGDVLFDKPGWHFVSDLQVEGRRNLEVVRADSRREKTFSANAPP
jgi:hypothetical protein